MLPTKARFGGSQHEENERLSRRNFWLILAVTAIMLTAFPFLVRPFSQKSNDDSPSPQPFTFFILPETSTFSEPVIPILVAVILPSELSQNYQLSDFFVISEGLFVPTFPLLEEPFFDSETNSFVWLFAGLFDASESNRAPAQYPFLLSAYAFFEPVIPSLPILSSFAQVSFSVAPSSYAVEPVELCPGPEICIEYFGIECTCPLPGDETTPPDGGTTPPDEDDEPPPSLCRGISYATPFPRLSGYIVEPVGEEVIVIAGDTLNLRANGSPDPDLDQTISRAPDPESGECSSSEKTIPGPSLSFIWRLWEDTDRDGKPDRLIGNIGYGKQISWRVPERAGVYYVELVVDDDGDPDKDNSPEKVKCAKCTAYSTADDPAVRDWVKVFIIPVKVQLCIHPDEPSTLNADEGEAFIVVGVWVSDPNHPDEWVEAEDGSEIRWEITTGNEGFISPTISFTHRGHAVTRLTTNRMAGNRYQVKATLIKLVYKSVVYPLNLSITSTPITVVPGRATRATLQLDRSYLPADERSIVSSQVTFWDAWGNLVEDSSPVFFSLKGFSSLIWGDSAYTIKGIAKNQQRAGFLPNSYGIVGILSPNEGGTESETTEGETLEIELDDVREVRLLPLVPLNVEVTVDQTTLTVGMGETAIVIAKVTDIFGRPVPDGTPVYWFSSAGSVTPRETTTSDGIAITTLSTASTNPLVHERFADGQSVKEKVLITATVPGNFVGCAEVVFARNPYLLTVRPRHLLLAGDVIGNGLMDQQGEILPDGYEQIEEVVWVEDEGVVIQTSIPYYASTILDIWVNPNEKVKVKVLSDLVALLDGAERKSEVKIQLNNEGYGKVILVSTGKLAGLEANVEVIVTSEETSQPSTPVIAASATRQGKAVIKLTAKKVFARLLGLAWRLTGWRGVWRTLGSLLAIWDIISILYEVGKFLPGGEEPDWVNLGFATASLVTSVSSVTGAGAVAEVVVNIADLLQRAFRRLGGEKGIHFAAKLVKVFQELLSKWDDVKGLAMAKLLDGLLAVDDQTMGAVMRIVGKERFTELMEICKKLEVTELNLWRN
jgi:hypothetical protein